MSNLQLSESDLELGEKILDHLQKNVISKLLQFLQIANDKNEKLKASTDSNKETQEKIRIKISHMSHIIEHKTIDENGKFLEKSYEELKDLLKLGRLNAEFNYYANHISTLWADKYKYSDKKLLKL